MTTERKFYVYLLVRPDTGFPFYVGMGSGNRCDVHERLKRETNPHKNNVIRKIHARGRKIEKIKIAQNLTREEAFALEIEEISLWGRKPNGILTNMTGGGDGSYDPSPELQAKRGLDAVARWADPAMRKKMNDRQKQGFTTAVRKRMSDAKVGKKLSTEHRRKLSQVHKGRPKSPEHIAALSAAGLGKIYSRERRAAQSVGHKNSVVSLFNAMVNLQNIRANNVH